MKLLLQTPVVIIGAGPSGAGCSIFLSKAGIPHIVLEKETFPRDKVCGDGCSGKTAYVLRTANPDWLQELLQDSARQVPSFGIKFIAPNGKALDIPLKMNWQPDDLAPGFTSARLHFDHFMFKKMQTPQATIFQNVSIKKIIRESEGVTVDFTSGENEYTLKAKIIVGADGDKSVVKKHFAPAENLKTNSVGLRAYYDGVTGFTDGNFVELHFLKEVLPGYFWIFPLPNGRANVGIGMPSEIIRKKKINLRQAMTRAIENNPAIAHRFKNATLSDKIQGWGLPMAGERTPICGDHFLLIGDAANLIDPFSGEGIGNALYSGMLAAKSIEQSLQAQQYNRSFFQETYEDVLYRRLNSEIKISTTLRQLCRNPWIFNFVVNKAHKSPALRTTLSGMFTDMDLREQLRRPSFYWKILTNQ
ncbi:NAD(P)/FAD-dependent oxidoreductase [Taibaiella soli]|uniref:Geranylgeranyl reductase n=1 Tax=Taibaiella soli TaxID=1649169 RepID=A0A2W2A969_9BACT|nr:geranylgeranyl reductase family protein [Taibaiella soli]PZF71811.1 geranylgeranyl reductase [Taibaiella soli]